MGNLCCCYTQTKFEENQDSEFEVAEMVKELEVMVEPELENNQEVEFRLVVLESKAEILPDTDNQDADCQVVVLETEPEVLAKPRNKILSGRNGRGD